MNAPLTRGLLSAFVATVAVALGALLLADAAHGSTSGTGSGRVLVASFDAEVNPVTSDYLRGQMHRAERGGYAAFVIEMDTPGGLSSSMRAIVKAILAAKVPVIVYVAPPGSSADSAGAVIAEAADVLALAPQTNIGSSTPIDTSGQNLGSDLRRKVINDAAAYIGELAREHGRNVTVAEQMVRKASNYGARDALRLHVIDRVSPSLPQLLSQVDGSKTTPKGLVLRTKGAAIDRVGMTFFQRARNLLIDPNLIELMLSIGLIGILVELWHPGLIFPGTVGAISLVLGLYGLQVLPVSVAGVALILLSFAFFAAEPFVMSHGALAVAGGVLFVIGSLILFDPAGPLFQVSLTVVIAIAATLTVLLGLALSRVVRARRLPVEVGAASRLVGDTAEVRSGSYVFADGELWRARTADGSPLQPGEKVTIEHVDETLELVVGSHHPTESEAP